MDGVRRSCCSQCGIRPFCFESMLNRLQYHMEEVSALSLYRPSRAQAPAGDEAQPEYLMRLLRDPSGSPQGRQR